MPSFLSALLALVMSFLQTGKPATLPPHTSSDVSDRGAQVSEIAKNLLTPKPSVTSAPGANNSNESAQGEHGLGSQVSAAAPEKPKEDGEAFGDWVSDQATNGRFADDPKSDNKIAAYNVKSGKPMPATIPQVAVDHSPALEPLPTATPTPTPAITPGVKKSEVPHSPPQISDL